MSWNYKRVKLQGVLKPDKAYDGDPEDWGSQDFSVNINISLLRVSIFFEVIVLFLFEYFFD